MYYVYNEQGVAGFYLSNKPACYFFKEGLYTFRKNLFGDITDIYYGDTRVASYKYDAWGNCTVENFPLEGTDEDFLIGNINPFRYRGYYWCEALQMYHLQTRWYDPTIGRFISPDSYEYLDPETIGGLNLYSYCLNNPVMYIDPTGHMPEWLGNLLIVGIGVLLIAGLAIATIATGGAAAGVAGAIFAGALKGALIGAAIGTVAGGAIGYAVDGVDGIWTGMAIGFTGGAVIGAVIGGAIGGVNYSPLKAASNAANKAIPSKGFNINKHLSTAGGKYSKFNLDSSDDILRMVQNGLKGQNVTLGPNIHAKSWQVIVDMGVEIGTKGQSAVKVIIGYGGKIWTMFPV